MTEKPADDLSNLTLQAVRARYAELSDAIVQTPMVRASSRLMDDTFGGEFYLKLECFQHTGTFKARGALSVARTISQADLAKGITAASAGNHAIAAAWAARHVGAHAKVVMQSAANPFRVAMAKAEGAELIIMDGGVAVIGEAQRLARDEGRTFIHPFEGINTTLGSAGVGVEMMQSVPDLDAVIVSVGGGGLISGVASAIKLINPDCAVYGVEPQGADSMSRSLAQGAPVTLDRLDTIADSLAPPMALPFSFSVVQRYVDDIVTISDDQICAGMVIAQEHCKLAVEPAAGAALAAAFGPLRARLMGKRIGVLICGANIDHATYAQLLTRGALAVSALTGR
ncbi:MAG: threonine dehydratase [Paracoccaceae bacterium]|jgi:threonine dehydratase